MTKSAIFAEISDIVEDVLLCNSGIGAEGFWVKFTVKILVDGALHPHVNGECLKVCEAEEGGAGCHLVTNTENLLQLGHGYLIACRFFNLGQVNFSAANTLCRIKQVFIPESRM